MRLNPFATPSETSIDLGSIRVPMDGTGAMPPSTGDSYEQPRTSNEPTPRRSWGLPSLSPRTKKCLYGTAALLGVAGVIVGATVGTLKHHSAAAATRPTTSGPYPDLSAPPVCTFGAGTPPEANIDPNKLQWLRNNVHNVVLMVQENHSFDQYLSKFLGVDGAPDNATQPAPGGKTVHRKHAPNLTPACPNHDWNAVHKEYNNGKMDGFALANAGHGNNGAYTMEYYDENDLPFLYGLMKEYAGSDRYFAPVMAGTKPNRAMLYLGSAYGVVFNQQNVPANATSIFDALTAKGVPWAIYATSTNDFVLDSALQSAGPGNFTNKYADHIKPIDQYYKDAAAGTLPPFAIVEPSHGADADEPATSVQEAQADEHPPGNIGLGQQFVKKYLDALKSSPQWQNSVFFLTYDEPGGYYDHVAPPAACEPDDIKPMVRPGDVQASYDRLSMRVPFVAAGPTVKKNYISHVVHDHTAITRFLGALFGFGALKGRDANSPALVDFFNAG